MRKIVYNYYIIKKKINMSEDLEYMRAYCSNWYIKHFGVQYDPTPWWNKWQIIGTFKGIQDVDKEKLIYETEIYNLRQNEQKSKKRFL